MERIYSGYDYPTGGKLNYEIIQENGIDNGFDIYIGDSKYPLMHQPEPFIPNPDLSYKENAIAMCKNMSEVSSVDDSVKSEKTIEERVNILESNMDYLMLLNDAADMEE